jgi:hypothetical protein
MYSFDLLTMAGGNLLVVIISTISIKNQVNFFFFIIECVGIYMLL